MRLFLVGQIVQILNQHYPQQRETFVAERNVKIAEAAHVFCTTKARTVTGYWKGNALFYALLISTGVFSVLATAVVAAMFSIERFWTLLITYFLSTVVVMALLSTFFLPDIAPWDERFLTIVAVAGGYTLVFASIRLVDKLTPDKPESQGGPHHGSHARSSR